MFVSTRSCSTGGGCGSRAIIIDAVLLPSGLEMKEAG